MILVVGATGILGGLITKRLLERGEEVRILLRNNSPAEKLAIQKLATSPHALMEAGAKPIYGDLKDIQSLKPALENIEVVITTANSAMRGGDDTVDSVDRQGNRNLIEVAKKANLKRFIFISFFGADIHHPVPLFQAKAETEAHLTNSGLPYTILSPNYFMESWISMVVGIPLLEHQPITLVGEGNRLHSLISIDDVASFSTAVMRHPKAVNQRFMLGGPEPLSWKGIVGTFSQVLGQDLPIKYVPPGNPIPGLPEMVPGVLAAMEAYDSPLSMNEISQVFGVEQITLSEFVKNMLNIPVT